MVDTIILEISLGNPKTQKIIDPTFADTWAPSLNGVLFPPYNKTGSGKGAKCVKNYTPEEKKTGIYVPRLTIYKQMVSAGFRYYLYVEFSAPKILFNNNFEEVKESDLNQLCKKLSVLLKERGINLTPEELRKSTVRSIHYSKNIILVDGTSPNRVLAAIKKANISTRKRISSEVYQDKGEGLHIYNNTRSLCVYDKIKELEKAKQTEQGNLELDSWCQFGVVGELFKKMRFFKSLDVIRFETRLKDKTSIRQAISPILSSLGYSVKSPYTLEMLFRGKLAKTILEDDFNEIKRGLPDIVSNRETAEYFVRSLTGQNPKATLPTIIQALGLRYLTGELGMRDARVAVGADIKQWNRFNSTMARLKYRQSVITNPLEQVEHQLDEFTIFRLGVGKKGV